LHPFLEGVAPNHYSAQTRGDIDGLQADGLSAEQISELSKLLAELGEAFRQGLATAPQQPAPLPADAPPFIAMGAEMPAGRLSRSPLFCYLTSPRGRSRKSSKAPSRPSQNDVDQWMLDLAESSFETHGLQIKQTDAERLCRTSINASRQQARVAFDRIPRSLRRSRGGHDRWRSGG
jgi:hypothetical protein